MISLTQLSLNETSFLVKITSAVVILFLGYIFGRVLSNLLRNILKSLEIDRIIRQETRFKFKLESRLTSLLKYCIYLFSLLWAMNQLEIPTTVILIVIALGVVFVIMLIILNLADIIPNFIAGLKLKHKKFIHSGQEISVENLEGTILDIGLVETKLKHKDQVLMIPNNVLLKKKVKILK
jgi:small-conductance mechanosensitive channel